MRYFRQIAKSESAVWSSEVIKHRSCFTMQIACVSVLLWLLPSLLFANFYLLLLSPFSFFLLFLPFTITVFFSFFLSFFYYYYPFSLYSLFSLSLPFYCYCFFVFLRFLSLPTLLLSLFPFPLPFFLCCYHFYLELPPLLLRSPFLLLLFSLCTVTPYPLLLLSPFSCG